MSNPQEFYTSFQAARQGIAARLESDNQTQLTSVQIAQIAQLIQAERKKLNEATNFLPAYDRRSYDSQLQELETQLDALRSKNAPTRGSFAFKKKAANTAPPRSTPTPKPEPEPAPTKTPALVPAEPTSTSLPNIQISSSSYKCFTPSSLPERASSSSTDLTITSLDYCIVDLLPSSSPPASSESESDKTKDDGLAITAIHIRDIRDSVLLLGHVQGSILTHNLERCVVAAACHQLRVHTSHNTRFHLHVSSNAIIEDCTALTFAPYPETLPLPSDVRQQKSRHTAIQDFSHLRATHSPNWSADTERPDNGTWEEIRAVARNTSGPSEEERTKALGWILTKILPQAQ